MVKYRKKMKVNVEGTLFFYTFIATAFEVTHGLSSTTSDAANRAKARLQESLSSPAKKMTISPEIIIPEPSDPTALLLQSTEVTKMSNTLRSKAKANAAFVSGSINSVKAFCAEQETARGNFPSPLPIIYCPSSYSGETKPDMTELCEAGVSGILYTLLDGDAISSPDEIKNDNDIVMSFQSAIESGVQLIPEVVLNSEVKWEEDMTKSLVDTISEQCGSEPAAILLTPHQNEGEENEGEKICGFPKIPKNLPPVLGSVRALAGGGRIGLAVSSCKESGLNGVVLRCDCLPGYRMNPDLEFVGGFWGAAIGDLKSTKSKNFNFRSKVALERDIPMEWFNYQKNVMESGALGGGDAGENPLDTENGDFKGF